MKAEIDPGILYALIEALKTPHIALTLLLLGIAWLIFSSRPKND